MDDTLTNVQRLYVENISRGMASRTAAKSAGYSDSYAKVAIHRLGKNPAVVKAIEDIRKKGREMASFGLLEAMLEANDALKFAKEKGHAMAVVKATELRSKLSGLLIDRVEIATVDLSAALQRAEQRVLGVTDGPSVTSKKSLGIDWAPRIPGRRIAEAAGPADIEPGSQS